ncbi:MAG TPA: lysophospholipase [Bdellovibrio sp.]|nr:lysophospholipase [Bdellovibrio sp.]
MYKRSEGFFKGVHDTNLFFQIWDNPQAQGTVIITHGHGEHSGCYQRLVDSFENDRWSFYAWDLRGHGKSDGRRGYAPDFDDYCTDFKIFLDMVLKEPRQGPVILLCHSMGALIQLKTLLRQTDVKFDAMIVSAPLLGLAMPVPAVKAAAASVLHKLLPQLTLGSELNDNMLTSDPDVIREYQQDPLRHTRMSSGVFMGMLESWAYVRPRANEVKAPALFILPEHDPVCSTPEAKKFFEKLGSKRKEIFIYPNAKHEVFNDVMRTTAFADLKKFMDSFLESK